MLRFVEQNGLEYLLEFFKSMNSHVRCVCTGVHYSTDIMLCSTLQAESAPPHVCRLYQGTYEQPCEPHLHFIRQYCAAVFHVLVSPQDGRAHVLAHPNGITVIAQSIRTNNIKTKTLGLPAHTAVPSKARPTIHVQRVMCATNSAY